jgi:excisionase family DNA binding protein
VDDLLRLSTAARRLWIHPVTLRVWADTGKIPVAWVGRERRFAAADVQAMRVPPGGERIRLEGLYVRVRALRGRSRRWLLRRRSCVLGRRARLAG